jgi:hypothetical protein
VIKLLTEKSRNLIRKTQENSMATIRYLVSDVDAALPFYVALGFTLADRWGPPFAMVKRGDLQLWISGPGGNQVLVEDPSGNPIELFEAKKQ